VTCLVLVYLAHLLNTIFIKKVSVYKMRNYWEQCALLVPWLTRLRPISCPGYSATSWRHRPLQPTQLYWNRFIWNSALKFVRENEPPITVEGHVLSFLCTVISLWVNTDTERKSRRSIIVALCLLFLNCFHDFLRLRNELLDKLQYSLRWFTSYSYLLVFLGHASVIYWAKYNIINTIFI
jgi:hypothetical protein